MQVKDVLRGRDQNFPSPDEILASSLSYAKAAYPNAESDMHALAFSVRTLAKNLAERTVERDKMNEKNERLLSRNKMDAGQ